MRIGLCHKTLDLKGGTERDLYLTARGLSELGHEVHLFCSEFDIAPPAGIFIHRIPVVPFGRTVRLWSFAAMAPWVIRHYPCDLVVSFGRMLYQDVLRCGGGSHRVFLAKVGKQGGNLRRLWHSVSLYHRSLILLEKQQFREGHFKLILAVSEEVKRELIATYAVSEDKIAVLYNGVDQHRFHPSVRTQWGAATRQHWGVPIDARVVLFVGSGFRRKGLDRLIRAWHAPALKECYLIVVGGDARINRYREMADRVAKGRIVFAGRQSEIEKYYGAADVVALPAVQEAFGNVVLEGLASGVPVVASQGVGAAEVLVGSRAGEVIREAEDLAELEARLVALLDRSREPATRLAARELGERYSWEKHFQSLEEHLQKVNREGETARIPEFVFLKRDGTRIWLHRALMETAALDALAEPDELLGRVECRLIKDQQKIRVGRMALTVNGLPTAVYIKRYNAFSWRYKLTSLFCRSGALRSLRGAMVLARIGVRTGRPLAVLESRGWGLLSRSFYISEEIASGHAADSYWRENLRSISGRVGVRQRRRFLQDLARLFYRLHAAGIYHNDLKDANILVRPEADGREVFYLVDLDGVRACLFLSWRRRVKNVVQLNRTLGRFLSKSEKLYWLQHYLGSGFDDRNVKRRWLQDVFRATRQADLRSRAKNNRA